MGEARPSFLSCGCLSVAVCPTSISLRQTGGGDEPDLRAVQQGAIVASVEATTSLKPTGAIGKRLRYTLAKLNGMPGQRYYLVCSEEMLRRACSVIKKNGYDIKVVVLSTIVPVEEQVSLIDMSPTRDGGDTHNTAAPADQKASLPGC